MNLLSATHKLESVGALRAQISTVNIASVGHLDLDVNTFPPHYLESPTTTVPFTSGE